MKLGQKIRAARTALGLTQKELGQKVRVSKQSISRWESGDDIPQGANLLGLTHALSLEHGWFAHEEGTDVTASPMQPKRLRVATAQGLQSWDPDSLDPPQRRGDVHAELNRAWLQVMVAYDARREDPDRWIGLKALLNQLVKQPEQERADILKRKRHRP